jgi:DNA-binding beta-propeller fold protein YncE
LILAALVLAAAMSVVFLSLAAPEAIPVHAAASGPQEWLIVVNQNSETSNTVSIIDPVTNITYGPVLTGELGSEGGGLFDVAVTPDGSTALISNFGDSTVYFVNVSNPISPSVITSVTTPFFAEDIAISHNGKFALVTDGGFSPLIAVIDLPSRTLAYTVEMVAEDAQAVDIAPNGTVIVADYFAGYIHSLYPDASGQLTVTGSYSYALTTDGQVAFAGSIGALDYAAGFTTASNHPSHATAEMGTDSMERQLLHTTAMHSLRPVNVVIAPDAQTILLCDVVPYNDPESGDNEDPRYAIGVYQIVAPGVLSFTGVVTDLTRATQSVAFNPAGTKAYLSGNGGYAADYDNYNHLAVLNITGPGQVTLDRDNAADYPRLTSSQLFGVDTLAVSNNKAYIGNPTQSDAEYALRVVNLSDYSVKRLDMPGIPVGVAVIPVQRLYLPLVLANQP